jgi:microcin C transport system permease protein
MRAYFLRRFLLIPPTLIGVTFVVFLLTRLVPGGPVEQMMTQMRKASAEGGGRGAAVGAKQALSEDQIEQLKEFFSLDDNNYPRAYLKWLGVWPKAILRKRVDFKEGDASIEVRAAMTREPLVIHRDGPGRFRVTRPDGSDAGPWKVRSKPPAAIADQTAEQAAASALERAEIYRTRFSGVVTGDLGRSTRYQDSVVGMIAERLPISAFYGLITLALSYLISIPLGILKALRHNRFSDNLSSVIVFAGYAIPSFVLGSLLSTWLGVRLGWFPSDGFTSHDFADRSPVGKVADVLNHAVLPLICYTIGAFALLTMLMKNQLMDTLSADYVRTAVAKGRTFEQAVRQDALRNALIPIATHFGHITTALVTGSFLIERVFDINGFGLLFFESAVDRDFPVVMGTTLLTAFLIMLGTIVSDALVALVDPRVKYS